jgi:hypothetical protein
MHTSTKGYKYPRVQVAREELSEMSDGPVGAVFITAQLIS